MNIVDKSQLSNSNFKRLYWSESKDVINKILSRVNIKYLKGLKKIFYKTKVGADRARLYVRYNGCEFQVSQLTINKELKRRANEIKRNIP